MSIVPGSLILESGSISDNTADSSNGGGIYIDTDCAFTMKGGSIDGNTVKNSATSHGGGVFVYGTFIMENGIITNNSSVQGNGGGVNIGTDGVFTMSDGTIKNNTATMNGGGVGVSTGNFTMTGGTLSGNTATSGNGGGVFVNGSTSNFTMTGGTIGGTEPNTAVLGGGVYVGTGSFTLGSSSTVSSPVVSGNTKTASSPNNVYLNDNTLLLIAGKLNKTEESGNIGITMSIPGEKFTTGWTNSGLLDTTFFFSDDSQYNVEMTTVDGGELQLINK